MKLVAGVGFAVALLAGLGMGLATATPFPALADGFSLDLPAGWVQIPIEAINQAEEEVARRAPNARQAHSDYGFQVGYGDRWFLYPYVLIHVDRQGRVPEAQLAKADNFSNSAATARAQEALKGVASGLDISKTRYDPSSHVLWLNMVSDVAGVGRVVGTSAIVPTEYGHIDVSGYALERDFLAFSATFKAFVAAITPDSSTRYQMTVVDYVPFLGWFNWEKILVSALAGGVLAGVGGWLHRRKK